MLVTDAGIILEHRGFQILFSSCLPAPTWKERKRERKRDIYIYIYSRRELSSKYILVSSFSNDNSILFVFVAVKQTAL